MTDEEPLEILKAHADAKITAREAMTRLDLDGYADLIIALAQHDLNLPIWPDTPLRIAHREKAREILFPRLKS